MSRLELYDALVLLNHLITTFTINERLKDFNSIEEISEWVKIKI